MIPRVISKAIQLFLKGCTEHGGFRARTRRNREGIAQRSQRSRRGIWLMDEISSMNTAASVQEPGATGKASHRGHRGHGGGFGLMDEVSSMNTAAFVREPGATGKASHRGHGGRFGLMDEASSMNTAASVLLSARVSRSAEVALPKASQRRASRRSEFSS
jgi:hypothetical protein